MIEHAVRRDGLDSVVTRFISNANPHMPEVGERFLGTVVRTTTFGAFVSLLPGSDGLLHVTQIRKLHGGRIVNVADVMHIGDKIQVEIREIDDRGKLSVVPVEVVERESGRRGLSSATDSSEFALRWPTSSSFDRVTTHQRDRLPTGAMSW